MCHLILALPIIGLPLLWLLPPADGIAAYGLVVVVSGAVYAVMMKAMHAPIAVGSETLLHAIGTVPRVEGPRVSIFLHGELWSAQSVDDPLAVGDRVEVVGRDGPQLRVHKRASASETDRQAAESAWEIG
jgi:membrane protein implicated in regulation of membrane protease activity